MTNSNIKNTEGAEGNITRWQSHLLICFGTVAHNVVSLILPTFPKKELGLKQASLNKEYCF